MALLDELKAALASYSTTKPAAPAPAASGVDPAELAEAFAQALARFSDSEGNLKVRPNTGRPYGGG